MMSPTKPITAPASQKMTRIATTIQSALAMDGEPFKFAAHWNSPRNEASTLLRGIGWQAILPRTVAGRRS